MAMGQRILAISALALGAYWFMAPGDAPGAQRHTVAVATSLLILVFALFVGFVAWFVSPLWTAYVKRGQNAQIENTYYDPFNEQNKSFPSVFDKETKYLSVIVPAYNEESRIPQMLDVALRYLIARSENNRSFTWEIIVVDDGSSDRTSETVLGYVKRHGTDLIRLLRLTRNQGKGAAVRQGMLRARGALLLMADADGASKFSDVALLEAALHPLCKSCPEGDGVVVGSRAHINEDAKAERTCLRWLLGLGFHCAVSVLCVSGVRDTQCGFKLFARTSARRLFPAQHIDRWAFDVELLFLAQKKMGMPIEEVPVNWVEIAGSKVSILDASLSMLRDMMLIRICYGLGIWTIDSVMKRSR